MKPTFIALLALCLCLPLMGADKKPLTKADLEKVTELILTNNQLTDVKWFFDLGISLH